MEREKLPLQQEEVSRAGKVEQVPVQDILLDTEASTTGQEGLSTRGEDDWR